MKLHARFLILFLFCGALFTSFVSTAQTTQTIRGQITDQDSGFPIIGATVVILNTSPLIGSSTDINGFFKIENAPIGRVAIKVSAIGYKETAQNNLIVVAGKQLEVNFSLTESVEQLAEVTVTATQNNFDALNETATVSARTFDMEQTSRFAGTLNDPARMATNFAGVSGANDARNDIIIRGNSPSGVLWRLEGIDIPSPNHFASFGSTGGPVSMLNYNLLAKSDFMTGAFPAEYGNALAGAFDLQMRKGNPDTHEFLGQIGFNGLEVGAEGPLSKKSKASYLVNYRYSTLGVFDAIGLDLGTGAAVPQYQDLSFKINIPTAKAGRFTIWGLGGDSNIELLGSELDLDSDTDLYGNENEDIYVKSRTAIAGITHTYFFNPKTSYKLSLAATYQREGVDIDSISSTNRSILERYAEINLQQNKYSAHLMVNHKLNAKNTFNIGVMADYFDVQFADSTLLSTGWFTIKEGQGSSTLLRAYANWQHRFTDDFVLNVGVHQMHYTLSQSTAIEPRVGIKYQATEKQSFALAYGLHHQLQPLPTYYTQTEQANGSLLPLNEDMGFTQSQHLVFGYTNQLFSDLRIKAELYYQMIDNVPVERFASSFSMLNAGADFGTPDNGDLVNEGEGRNYGLELSVEKSFSKNYYFMLNASLFNAEYKGSDGVWRNSAFNGRYVANLLAGKEWKLGTNSTLAVDWKITAAGGRYYTPIDLEKSREMGFEVLQEDNAFSEQFQDYFRTDLKISYRMNKRKITHEFALDLRNISNTQNEFRKSYNRRTGTVTTEYQLGLFPVPQYRILF